MNRRGEKPDTLGGKSTTATEIPEIGYQNVVGQDDLTRFDKKRNRGQQQRNNSPRRDRRDNRDNRDRRDSRNANNGRDERGFHPDGERRRDNRPRNNNAPRNNERNNPNNTPK